MRFTEEMVAGIRQPFENAMPIVFRSAHPDPEALFSPEKARRLLEDDTVRCGEFSPGHEKLSLVANEALIPQEDLVSYEETWRLQEKGATVLFRMAHRYHRPVHSECTKLANLLQQPVYANGYWTTNGPELPLRSEDLTFVAVQTAGTKTWLIFPPRAESLNDREKLSWVHQGTPSIEAAPPETAKYRIITRSGDALLIPRGWPHYTLAKDESLQISFVVISPETDKEIARQQQPVLPR